MSIQYSKTVYLYRKHDSHECFSDSFDRLYNVVHTPRKPKNKKKSKRRNRKHEQTQKESSSLVNTMKYIMGGTNTPNPHQRPTHLFHHQNHHFPSTNQRQTSGSPLPLVKINNIVQRFHKNKYLGHISAGTNFRSRTIIIITSQDFSTPHLDLILCISQRQ